MSYLAQRLARVRKKRAKKPRAKKRAKVTVPPLKEFLRTLVHWPHERTSLPIAGLTPIMNEYIDSPRRTAFQLGDDGMLLPGADILAKSRKIKASSCSMGCLLWCMCRWPGCRTMTVLHKTAGDIGNEIYRRMVSCVGWLPPGYPTITSRSSGASIVLDNGSMWLVATAGATEDVSAAIARGGTIHAFHLSEAALYRNPRQVWAAIANASPGGKPTVICESTFWSTEDWFYEEYTRAKPGGEGGAFLSSFFWPWLRNPDCVIHEHEPHYAQMMAADFPLDEADRLMERKLSLSPEQVAWRRLHYCWGNQKTREGNRREHPEDDRTWAAHSGDGWFDSLAIAIAQAECVDPSKTVPLTPTLSLHVYDEHPSGMIVAGIDCASRRGEDYSASVFLDQATRNTVAVIHGKALASEHAAAIQQTLEILGVAGTPARYMLVPERNRDFGLIDELDLRRLRMYAQRVQVREKGRKIKKETTKSGIYMGAPFKRDMLDTMARWLEGVDEDRSPQCQLRHLQLVSDVRAMKDTGKTVEAVSPEHDDLADAWGIALWVCDRVRPPAAPPSAPPPRTHAKRGRSGSRH